MLFEEAEFYTQEQLEKGMGSTGPFVANFCGRKYLKGCELVGTDST